MQQKEVERLVTETPEEEMATTVVEFAKRWDGAPPEERSVIQRSFIRFLTACVDEAGENSLGSKEFKKAVDEFIRGATLLAATRDANAIAAMQREQARLTSYIQGDEEEDGDVVVAHIPDDPIDLASRYLN